MSGEERSELSTQSVVEVRPPTKRPRTAFLIVAQSREATGRMFRLEGEGLVIGRALDASIRLEDLGMSRYHARVHVRGEQLEVIDLGSKNGLFYEGEAFRHLLLSDGAKFQVGSTILKVAFQDDLDEKLQQNLYEQATRDALTGLYNRRFFEEALAKDFTYCNRRGSPLSVVLFDIDHFKSINDTYGHAAGDVVLAKVGAVLTEGIRSEDVGARIGGEEFALLLRECPEADSVRLADRLRRAVEKSGMNIQGTILNVTMSAGVACQVKGAYPEPGELVKAADRNLYRAKHSGRNRVLSSSEEPLAPW